MGELTFEFGRMRLTVVEFTWEYPLREQELSRVTLSLLKRVPLDSQEASTMVRVVTARSILLHGHF